MKAQRVILVFVVLAAVALAGAIAWRMVSAGHEAEPAASVGGPFELVDQNGRRVDEDVLKGKWNAVFFGFTYCPDVCPTTLHALNEADALLTPKQAKDFRVVFVTVDPERDTPRQMKAYLDAQDLPPDTVGLTGTSEQVKTAAQEYRVYYQKVGEGDAYTVNHSTAAYLMDPKGRFNRVLGYGMTPDQMAEQISAAMG